MKKEHYKEMDVVASVITVSSTRTVDQDTSGTAMRELLEKASIPVARYHIVPDHPLHIQSEVLASLSESNCVILTGGTGLTHDDCTIEAVLPLLEKTIDGFGELFRWKSYHEIGAATILSRALGGIRDGKVVFCLPGSSKAVTLALNEIIIPEIRHILTHAVK